MGGKGWGLGGWGGGGWGMGGGGGGWGWGLGGAGVEPEGYSLVVPRTKTAWRWGPVDLLEAIGETGLVNLATVDIVEEGQLQAD